MPTRSPLLFLAINLTVFAAAGAAFAQSTTDPASAAIGGSAVLITLCVCGLMGMVGQACRAIVGLSTLAVYKINSAGTDQDLFNLSRLLFSLIVGFVAGVVAGLTQWHQSSNGIAGIDLATFDSVVKFAIAGYIGTDIIEAFTTQFFEPAVKPGPESPTPPVSNQDAASAKIKPTGPVIATHLTAGDQSVVSAKDVMATMQDVAVLKTSFGGTSLRVAPLANAVASTTLIYGFDCDHYPGDAVLGWLRIQADFRVSVCYIAHSPGGSDRTWTSKVAFLKANGWGLLPTYAGLQIHSAGLSTASGNRDGAEAASLMTTAGFAPSTIIYLDLEDGTPPTGSYRDYIKAWIQTVTDKGFTPALYCSHLIVQNVKPLTPIIWSFHIPAGTEGQTYDPAALPKGGIDAGCIATQYRQKVNLVGLTIPATVDSEGIDINVCAVADPSNFASVSHALQI